MKANELMIGDWVQHRDEFNEVTGPYEIDLISNDEIAFKGEVFARVFNNSIEPIPLTPEILEKNGFSGEGYNMGIVGFSVELIPDKKDGYEVFIWKDMCLQIEHGFTHFKKYIKYVHQLQHALRICGIEHEITL